MHTSTPPAAHTVTPRFLATGVAQVLARRLQYAVLRRTRPVTRAYWLEVIDCRHARPTSLPALQELLQRALDLLGQASCDDAVRATLHGVILVDGERWTVDYRGIVRAALTGPFAQPVPVAMRLLWTSVWLRETHHAMKAGSLASAPDVHATSYAAVDAFATHLLDAPAWQRYAADVFAPRT